MHYFKRGSKSIAVKATFYGGIVSSSTGLNEGLWVQNGENKTIEFWKKNEERIEESLNRLMEGKGTDHKALNDKLMLWMPRGW